MSVVADNMPATPGIYLTYVPGRAESYKYHATIKNALAAMKVRHYKPPGTVGKIWEWIFNGQDGGRWVLVMEFPS